MRYQQRCVLVCLAFLLLVSRAGLSPAFAQNPFGNPEGPPHGGTVASSLNGLIEQVPYSELECNFLVTFEDVAGGPNAGTNYDNIVMSGDMLFAERFVGQTLFFSGNFDVLSGIPSGPLALQVGAQYENINIITFDTNIMDGLGPLGFPDPSAIGEGAVGMLFELDQSEFGVEIIGSGNNGGSAWLNFFRLDGTLIDTITMTDLADGVYGFRRAFGIEEIRGISIHNEDFEGIAYDNICHDVTSAVATEESSWGRVKALFR